MQYFISFLEGIITFISPCHLPLLPVYISYFAGGEERNTKKTVINALGFTLGFSLIFILMGALAGTFGMLLNKYDTVIDIITGIIVIFFGLGFLGVFNLHIFHGLNIKKPTVTGFFSSVLFGIVFSISLTPCSGAFLGSALMLAANAGSVFKGIVMLVFYSFGMAIPFFLSAILIDKLKGTLSFVKKHHNIINIISGVLLIVVGILMATGLFHKFLHFFN